MTTSKLLVLAGAICIGTFSVVGIFFIFDPAYTGGIYPTPAHKDATSTLPIYALSWAQETASASWETRDSGEAFLFDGKLWIMGGLDGNVTAKQGTFVEYWTAPHFNDIWNTEDGVHWTQVATTSAWAPRRSMSVALFNGKLWMLGGWSPATGYTSDVWNSADGIHWAKVVENAEWPAREGQMVEVFQNKLWLIGGVNYDERQTKNDVWYSDDGITWTQAEDIPWAARWDHATVVFNGKLYMAGGMNLTQETFHDVWVSDDGLAWSLLTDTPRWEARQGHALESYKERLWLIGRLNDAESGGANDVWYSDDGIHWYKTLHKPPWAGREDFFSAVFNDKLWVFGGMDSSWTWQNDVWSSDFPLL